MSDWRDSMPKSILMVLDERARQVVEEGYDGPHDMGHEPDDLATAGAVYALPEDLRRPAIQVDAVTKEITPVPYDWPWTPGSWKPSPDERIRELVKAGALIVAEIDRMIMEERIREHA